MKKLRYDQSIFWGLVLMFSASSKLKCNTLRYALEKRDQKDVADEKIQAIKHQSRYLLAMASKGG